MAEIKCPICGETNAASVALCSNCNSPLQPKENIQSGQAPTKKHTAELEPVLPKWLRDARDAARNPDIENPAKNMPEPQEKAKPATSAPDFLAGLQAQTTDKDDEEVPDWLANITGASPTEKPEKDEPLTDARWVEVGDKDDFAKDIFSEFSSSDSPKQEDDNVPPWLASLQDDAQPEKDELSAWLEETEQPQPSPFSIGSQFNIENKPKDESFETPTSSEDTPDWLKQMSAEAQEKESVEAQVPKDAPEFNIDAPDWLSSLSGSETSDFASTDTPDWLKQMSAEQEKESVEAQVPKDAPEFNIDAPDWLSNLSASGESNISQEADAEAEADVPANEADVFSSIDIPAWLKNPNDEAADETSKSDTTTPIWLKAQDKPEEAEVPAWLASEQTIHLDEPQQKEEMQDDVLSDMPSWLKAATPQATIFDDPVDELKFDDAATEAQPVAGESSDWLDTLKGIDAPAKSEPPALDESISPFSSVPAFTPDAQFTDENPDELFTEMPDWLSNAMDLPATPTPVTNEDVLPSSNLPSWVEAMRPSDSKLPQLSGFASDQTLESRGALAGLQGVLPAAVGFAPTSKPKAYSIKLNANDDQLKDAGILEQIVAAETSPVPIESFASLRSSRALRWTIALLLLITTISTLFLRTQIFSMPFGRPNEVSAAISVIGSIPENAPLLVAFDYEPSRAAEMEAAAAPVFDNLMLLKHPRLTLIATNETGSMLAERFMTGTMAGHNYQSGVLYSNLGYLPAGQLGVRAFAQNPSMASPFDIYLQPAWDSAPQQGITSLNQFTAMILITDNADSARVWVEQTETLRDGIPFIVISSAQSAPMIQPYYDSGQVNGIVAGLYGGALFEQYNAGRPGIARNYWDAYSIGMLMAMILVLGGSFWSLIVGLRERREAR